MEKFRTGNVILNPYNRIEIVVRCSEDKIDVIPFDYENSSGTHKMKTYEREESCFCYEGNAGDYDEDCEFCKGTGSGPKTIVGWENSKFLAPTVKDYIVKRMLKNFEF